MKKLLLWHGRVSRSEFFTIGFVLNLISAIIEALNGTLPDGSVVTLVASLLSLAAFALMGYVGVCLTIRRLHDINQPGWMYWAFMLSTLSLFFLASYFIPLLTYPGIAIALVGVVIIYFKKGTSGDNKYGPDPLAPKTQPIVDDPLSDAEQ